MTSSVTVLVYRQVMSGGQAAGELLQPTSTKR
jgi:hypothetical protein